LNSGVLHKRPVNVSSQSHEARSCYDLASLGSHLKCQHCLARLSLET
jgi:hypothetical protein